MTDVALPLRRRRRVRLGPRARAFFAAPSAWFAVVMVGALVFFAAFGPALFQHDADTQSFAPGSGGQGPSWDHLLGTDALGRDILARILVGTRLSLLIGLSAAGLACVIGVLVGAGAALLPTRSRTLVLRFVDAMVSFPALLKAIVVGVIVGQGAMSVILGIGIAGSFGFARTTSTLALSVGGREFVNAARVLGVRPHRLLFKHVIPNIAESLILFLGIAIGLAEITSAGLGYLGVGVHSPDIDWGLQLNQGLRDIYGAPAAAIGPAVAVALAALSFSYAGEAGARALNPLLWTASRKKRRPMAPAVTAAGALPGVEPEPDAVGDAPADAALTVRGLEVSFPGPLGRLEIVKGVSFSVGRGEILGIVGESGSGKSMTALAVAQLIPYPGRVTGSVELHGRDLLRLSRRELPEVMSTSVAMVFQDPSSSLNPALRIGEQLTEAARTHRRLSRRAARKLAAERLEEVHIPAARSILDRYPHELSGGMRQRVMIAMSLMNEPSVLLCDEPTTALDVTIQAQIMDLLNEVNTSRGTAILVISHNLALISQNCDRIVVMYAGRVIEDLDAAQLHTNPRHPYTRALLHAAPEFGQARHEQLESIPGEPVDTVAPPPGCPFHPRCPIAIDRCTTERPPLLARPAEEGRRVACHRADYDPSADGDEADRPGIRSRQAST